MTFKHYVDFVTGLWWQVGGREKASSGDCKVLACLCVESLVIFSEALRALEYPSVVPKVPTEFFNK